MPATSDAMALHCSGVRFRLNPVTRSFRNEHLIYKPLIVHGKGSSFVPGRRAACHNRIEIRVFTGGDHQASVLGAASMVQFSARMSSLMDHHMSPEA